MCDFCYFFALLSRPFAAMMLTALNILRTLQQR